MRNDVYKDNLPIDTVNRIRQILSSLNIFVYEYFWISNFDNLFSCSLIIEDTDIVTNGKGITREYALASAYGELLERLQNLAFFKLQYLKNKKKMGFFWDINEIREPINNYSLPIPFQKEPLLNNYGTLQKFWENYKENYDADFHTFIPFFNISQNKKEYLPYYIVKYYRSNGMASGNTKEEALTQGISEIIERYAQREIFLNEITPPTITKSTLEQQFPSQYQYIKKIEESGRYKVVVKDCSLGKNLPVIGAVIYDTNDDTYFTSFGAEPTIEYAIARTITEAFQGKETWTSSKNTKNLNLKRKKSKQYMEKQLDSSFIYGAGEFPTSFFKTDFSYSCSIDNSKKFITMGEKLNYLVNIVHEMNFEIYIRDCSYLNFPAYHVIIPGMSATKFYNENSQRREKNNIDILNYLKNINELNHEQLKKFLFDIENNSERQLDNIFPQTLNQYLPIYLTEKCITNDISLDFLSCLISFKLGDFEKSYKLLNNIINTELEKKTDTDLKYHFCVRQYLALLCNGEDNKDSIKKILINFYDEKLVEKVFQDMDISNNIFKYIPKPNCPDCENCQLVENCNQDKEEEIYLAIKKAMYENPIDQNNLKELI